MATSKRMFTVGGRQFDLGTCYSLQRHTIRKHFVATFNTLIEDLAELYTQQPNWQQTREVTECHGGQGS